MVCWHLEATVDRGTMTNWPVHPSFNRVSDDQALADFCYAKVHIFFIKEKFPFLDFMLNLSTSNIVNEFNI